MNANTPTRPTKDGPKSTTTKTKRTRISKQNRLLFLGYQRTSWGRTKLSCNLPSVAAASAYPRRAIRRAEACRGRARRAGASREVNISGGVYQSRRRPGGGRGKTHFVFLRCLWCNIFLLLNGYARELIRKPAEIRHYSVWHWTPSVYVISGFILPPPRRSTF